MARLAGEGVRVEVVVVVLDGEIVVLVVVLIAVLDGEVELLGIDELVTEKDVVGVVVEVEMESVMLSGPAVGYEVIVNVVEGVAFEVKVEVVMSARDVVEDDITVVLFMGVSAELKVELATSGRIVLLNIVVKSEQVLSTSDVCCENVDAGIVVVIATDRDPVRLSLDVEPGVLDVVLISRV